MSVPGYIAIIVATNAIMGLPINLASYRAGGVLRRFRAAPLPPAVVLGSQVAVGLIFTAVGSVLLVVAGRIFFGLRLPEDPAVVLGAVMLSAASIFAFGFILASVLPNARTAQSVAMVVFFPMMFLSGAALSRQLLSATIQDVAQALPLTTWSPWWTTPGREGDGTRPPWWCCRVSWWPGWPSRFGCSVGNSLGTRGRTQERDGRAGGDSIVGSDRCGPRARRARLGAVGAGWHGVFYGVLVLAAVLALADPATAWPERAAVWALAMAFAGWYWQWVVRRRIWTLPFLQVLVYFGGAAAP